MWFSKRAIVKHLKHYKYYDDYLNHQMEKTCDSERREKWTTTEWDMKIKLFTNIFEKYPDVISPGKRALCLCARMGQEVVALENMGLKAIGIDLVPNLPHVIEGDIHKLEFEDETFDFIFSNSFDHSLYPDIFVKEMERVLLRGGHSLVQFQFGETDEYAETEIHNIDSVIPLYENSDIVVSHAIKPEGFASYTWEVLAKKR